VASPSGLREPGAIAAWLSAQHVDAVRVTIVDNAGVARSSGSAGALERTARASGSPVFDVCTVNDAFTSTSSRADGRPAADPRPQARG